MTAMVFTRDNVNLVIYSLTTKPRFGVKRNFKAKARLDGKNIKIMSSCISTISITLLCMYVATGVWYVSKFHVCGQLQLEIVQQRSLLHDASIPVWKVGHYVPGSGWMKPRYNAYLVD